MGSSRRRKEVQIAAKMYEAREVLQRLFGEEYATRVERYRVGLRRLAAAEGRDILPTMFAVLKKADANDSGFCLWLLAAAVDLIEADTES